MHVLCGLGKKTNFRNVMGSRVVVEDDRLAQTVDIIPSRTMAGPGEDSNKVIRFPVERRDPTWEAWVNEAAVARHLSVSPRTVRRWRSEGMPSRIFSGSRRYRLSEVEGWHKERGS